MSMENYTEVKVLREAIYGKVIHCIYKKTKDPVAIKLMSLVHMSGKKAVNGTTVKEDGSLELLLMRMFTERPHKNVLSLQKDFIYKGFRCLVLEFCAKGELFDQLNLQKEKRFPEKLGKFYFAQIVDGLSHIHSFKVAHRDLSLENILVNSNDICKICDFGLAAENGDSCSGRVGKSFYMAPEVFKGGSYCGFTADIWSLGILLFIMLTGIPPLELPSSNDARFNVLQNQGIYALLKMWKMLPWFSTEVVDLISKMLVVPCEQRISLADIRRHSWLRSYFPANKREKIVLRGVDLLAKNSLTDAEILAFSNMTTEEISKKSNQGNLKVGDILQEDNSPNTSDGSTVISDESPNAEILKENLLLSHEWNSRRSFRTNRFNLFASSCSRCNTKYGLGFITKRHRCRYCQQSICTDCSNKRAFMPHGASVKAKRLCDDCFTMLCRNGNNKTEELS